MSPALLRAAVATDFIATDLIAPNFIAPNFIATDLIATDRMATGVLLLARYLPLAWRGRVHDVFGGSVRPLPRSSTTARLAGALSYFGLHLLPAARLSSSLDHRPGRFR